MTVADEKYSRLFEAVRPVVSGACLYCSRAYGVKDAIEQSGVPFVSDFKDHPSLHALVAAGFQVITFSAGRDEESARDALTRAMSHDEPNRSP